MRKIIVICVIFLNLSCVEEINLTTETVFENVLVVEATITNEFKHQEIKLSRTYPLESDGPTPESNAAIKLIEASNEYIFQEVEPGTYQSIDEFEALQNVNYQLEIVTSDGNMYGSSTEQLTTTTQIDELYFEVGLNENNEEGISIFVDAYDPSGNSKFYRHTFEESYKIIAPYWVPEDLYVVEYDFPACPVFAFQPKQEEQQICFNTEASKKILLENTSVFEEDRIERLRVRFLNKNNYIISHRYRILVNQYVQSREAHNYYEVLRNLSESENLLSENQGGFIEGNIFSMSNTNEKVVGYFEVSSVDTKEIWFNYADVFPGEPLPPYYVSCNLFAPEECDIAGNSDLADAISESQGAKYYSENNNPSSILDIGPYSLVAAPCGDCTVLGNNVPPDFWIE